MRWLRWAIVVFAVGVGVAVFAASEKPTTVRVTYSPRARLVRADVDAELGRARVLLERHGYALVREVAIDGAERAMRVTDEVPVGQCLAVVAGAWGLRRIASIEWLTRVRVREEAHERLVPYSRFVIERACPMRESALRPHPAVTMEIALDGHSGEGAALVLRGPAHAPMPSSAPVDGDRIVHRDTRYGRAIGNGILAACSLALILLMVAGSLRAQRDERERERELRRFTIALPAEVRGALAERLNACSTPAGARALRDALIELAPMAVAAVFQRWRGDAEVIDARHAELTRRLASRRVDGRTATYRATGEGFLVLTLIVRHRCELPELPTRLDAAHLAFALEISLPRDDRELISADAFVLPTDRTESLDAAQVATLFPELVRLATARASCAACEASVARVDVPCAACGEPLEPRDEVSALGAHPVG